MPLILGTNSIKDTGYDVANSLRTNKSDQPRGVVTQGTPTNVDKYTFSVWVKRADIGASNSKIFSVSSGSTYGEEKLEFNNDDLIWRHTRASDGETVWQRVTDRKFRDPSAWYNIIVAYDSSQGTAANRCKMYINGVEETSFSSSSNPSSGLDSYTNTSSRDFKFFTFHENSNTNQDATAYFAELVYIDGQQLDQTSFGEFDSGSPNIWKPIDVSGLTFGNNGFYLDFENSGSLGADVSGNGNNFTVNNLTSIDQSTDTCTNNFATLNPNQSNNAKDSVNSLAEGNLRFNDTNNADWRTVIGTLGVNSGKWYWEAEVVGMNGSILVGVGRQNYLTTTLNKTSSAYPGADSGDFSASYRENGIFYTNGSSSSGKSTFTSAGDIVMVALDMDNGAVYFGVNGTWNDSGDPTSGASKTGASYTGIQTGEFYSPSVSGSATNSTIDFNFGNPPFTISSGNSDANGYGNFEYAVPSGYYALNSKNLAEFG